MLCNLINCLLELDNRGRVGTFDWLIGLLFFREFGREYVHVA
jgi:hypothetical protein